jgi:hypothetical protein
VANLSACIRTLEDVLDGYELAAGAREHLGDVLRELRAPARPGPWHLDAGQVKTAAGVVVASVPWDIDGPEDDATARLVCAAPELLEACRAVVAAPMRTYPDGASGYLLAEDVAAQVVWAAIQRATKEA